MKYWRNTWYFRIAIITSILSLISFFIGIGGSIFLNYKFQQGIRDEILVDSFYSNSYNKWQSNNKINDAPMFLNFYIWNITNPKEIEKGSLPHITQVGPYSYREYWYHFNVSFNKNGTEISYRKWKYFIFNQKTSFYGANPKKDMFTVVNVPFQAVLASLTYNQSESDKWWKILLFSTLASHTNSTLFTKLTAEQLFFGYEDPLLNYVSSFKPGIQTTFQIQINETSMDESYNTTNLNIIKTGKDNLKNILNFIKWNNKTSVNCWASTKANQISGNDGTQFWPGINENDNPKIFANDLFRMISFNYSNHINLKGINLLRYKIPIEGLENATNYPPNKDFYQFGHNGIQNLTNCEKGVPIFISKPHFLDGPWYQKRVIGINPNSSIHNTFLDIEPYTGITMNFGKRIQINIKLQKEPILYPNIQDNLYIPIIWLDENAQVTDLQIEQFKNEVYTTVKLIMIIKWVGIGSGSLFFLISFILFLKTIQIYKKEKKKNNGYKPINIDD